MVLLKQARQNQNLRTKVRISLPTPTRDPTKKLPLRKLIPALILPKLSQHQILLLSPHLSQHHSPRKKLPSLIPRLIKILSPTSLRPKPSPKLKLTKLRSRNSLSCPTNLMRRSLRSGRNSMSSERKNLRIMELPRSGRNSTSFERKNLRIMDLLRSGRNSRSFKRKNLRIMELPRRTPRRSQPPSLRKRIKRSRERKLTRTS